MITLSDIEKLYTLKDACKMLGINRQNLYRQIKLDRVKSVRIGKKIMLKESTIEDISNNGINGGLS